MCLQVLFLGPALPSTFDLISEKLVVSPVLRTLTLKRVLPYVKEFASMVCQDWPEIRGFISCHYSRRIPATTLDFRRAFGFAFSGDATEEQKEPGGFLQGLGLDRFLGGGATVRRGTGKDNADPLAEVPREDLATLNSVNDFVVKYGLADEGFILFLPAKTYFAFFAQFLTQQQQWPRVTQSSQKSIEGDAPNGTPARKGWHVERCSVTKAVFKALQSGDGGPRLVGLVGDSGSGKTTAAADVVSSKKAREAFCDGIFWLPINVGAKHRLPSLMQKLATMFFEHVDNSVGHLPIGSEDRAAYIKHRMRKGRDGTGLKCLVVADNVWEPEVVSKLLETGMWVLLSTRDREMVSAADGEPVGVDMLSEPDARAVLRKASELSPKADLPEAARELIECCGRVAMDLAFIGRWSDVRGRDHAKAWSTVRDRVKGEMDKAGVSLARDDSTETRAKRRKAIFQAGLEDLASAVDDQRVERLFLSLAIMPDGHAFSLEDAAVLLYDPEPSKNDVDSAAGVVDILERWSILDVESAAGVVDILEPWSWLHSTGWNLGTKRMYHMHDALSGFARERLKEGLKHHHDVVYQRALERWRTYISSLGALQSIDPDALVDLWRGLDDVGGSGWDGKNCPYTKALGEVDNMSDRSHWTTLRALARFQGAQRNWIRASTTWRRLLEVQEAELGNEHEEVLETVEEMSVSLFYSGRSSEVVESLRRCLVILEARLGREHDRVTNTRHELGVCLRAAGRLDEAEELLRCCLEIVEAKSVPNHDAEATMLHHLGICIRMAGRLGEAENLLRRSVAIQEAEEQMLTPDTLHELAVCVQKAGRLEEAETLFRRCLTIKKAKLGPEKYEVAVTLHSLGLCVEEADRLREAEKLLRRSAAIIEADLGPENDQLAVMLYNLEARVREAGRLEEADELLKRCLKIDETNLGPEDARVVTTLHRLISSAREAGRLQEEEELLRRCLAIGEANPGREDVRVASTLYSLGVCVRKAGRLQEAEDLLRRCLAIEEAELGPEHGDVATTLHELGWCLQEAGRLQEAEELLRRCLAIREAELGPEHKDVATTLYELGTCVGEAGRLQEAEELLRCGLAIDEAELGPEHKDVATTLHELGWCLQEAGRLQEAEGLLRRGLAIREAGPGPEPREVATMLYELGRPAGGGGGAVETLSCDSAATCV
eukprot:g14991.t1